MEDLGASGLTYVPGSVRFLGTNVAAPTAFEPNVSGPLGNTLTWDFSTGPVSAQNFSLNGYNGGFGSRRILTIEFQVQRHPSTTLEGLVSANRAIEASVDLVASCDGGSPQSYTTGQADLPLREPEPVITKGGRNVDAAQGGYSDPVYGHTGDDVIWRIRITNPGQGDLQDFEFDDTMVPGNFLIHYVCDTAAQAVNAANGSPPSACVNVGSTTSLNDFDVRAAFGGAANPYIVAPAGGSQNYYLVGRVTDSCVDRDNTVDDVEWGCQVESPTGGISATSTGQVPTDSAELSTFSQDSGVNITVDLDGVNTAQPMGARGTVTITIRNRSGGTIRGGANGIVLQNVLPAEYVVDPTFAPTITVDPAYGGSYGGMVDTITWTNPAPNTFPLATNNIADLLSNTNPRFELTSSTTNADFPSQRDMIRHGDDVIIRFRTVLIDPTYYDLVANLDVREEDPASNPPGTDPIESFPITHQLAVQWYEFCTGNVHDDDIVENDTARPEDLDIDMVGSELLFILTNTGDPLPLSVELTNRGGHDATDYQAWVTFGEAMVVSSVPPGCSPSPNPPALDVWQIPTALPTTAAVYRCDRGTISPGETERFDFEVVANTAFPFDDDLTFRADVIGEIALADGTRLFFPAPTPRPDGVTDPANDYTIDAIWARVIGYNLNKTQLGTCSENNPPPGTPDDRIEIGEECEFFVETGGWFGFETPGFQYIAVQNISLTDQLPDGQGYIESDDPAIQSTAQIQGITLLPPPNPLDEGDFGWTFNTVIPGERITARDHWFRTNVTTRLLNDPQDSSAPPNVHAAQSSNVMVSTFEAVFFNQVSMMEELYTLGPSTVGYPREVWRRVDLTVTEPELTVETTVCNETIYGAGPSCSNFTDLADDGDAYDTYIYRVRVTNTASTSGVARAPAYDVTVTSTTDASDLLEVDPLTGDLLDNDADGLVDAGDAAGEGTITDNTTQNAIPAQVIASYTHSVALLKIDAGSSVDLYFRVDPDDDTSPQQQLVVAANATYDSLEGASGNQSAPQGANGDLGGARRYTSADDAATIQIIPVQVDPKQILRTSNTPITGTIPQPVTIGEEVEFELRALIPVSQLRDFEIRDTLPAGMRCVDAPDVDLDAAPYDAAGFMPGGSFSPTCTDTEVVWSFGDQTITTSDRTDRLFEFGVTFVARIDNEAANQDGTVITNGSPTTLATVSYVDDMMNTITLDVPETSVVVQEPDLTVTKAIDVATADAADVATVTMTLTNGGTSMAYNPRVLDDLTSGDLVYAGNIQGATPPTANLAILGPQSPVFEFAPGFGIAPGDSLSFTFDVQLADTVEPGQIIPNVVEIDWTSLPLQTTALNGSGTIDANGTLGGMRNGALPNASDPVNDYEASASTDVTVPPLLFAKNDTLPTQPAEIGSHRAFEIVVTLPEGMTRGVSVTDDLSAGAVGYVYADNVDFDVTYSFPGIEGINGAAPSEAALLATPADGSTGTITWTIGDVDTLSEDDLTTNAITPQIRIQYWARIENDAVTDLGDTLQNDARLTWTDGETGLLVTLSDQTAVVTAIEPVLAVTKTLANATPGKTAGDPAAFNDILEYVVTALNTGTATAYDVNFVDTLPPELTLDPSFTPTAVIGGSPVVGFVATPGGAPGPVLDWGSGNGDGTLDIPSGQFLELTYHVTVSTPLPVGAVLSNSVVTDWTSLDGPSIYERFGDNCPTPIDQNDYCFGPATGVGPAVPVPPAGAPTKTEQQSEATIGEAFRYRIRIPAATYPFDIFDVRISDILTSIPSDLRFIRAEYVSGTNVFAPVNTGTPDNLVIEDVTTGIDIPADTFVELDLVMVVEDVPANAIGDVFANSITYSYDFYDGDETSRLPASAGDTSGDVVVTEPIPLVMTKTGPATISLGVPATITLDLRNDGTSRAWNPTILDILPDGPTGGTCDTAPTDITAEVFDGGGSVSISGPLAQGSDFAVTWRPAPDCELELNFLTAAGSPDATERLIVTYDVLLDVGSQDGIALTNFTGATEWFSTDGLDPDTVADRRTYSETVTDGSPGTPDFQDEHTFTTSLPSFFFEKTVENVSSGQNPATLATPGDLLEYTLTVTNTGTTTIPVFQIQDELDRLNATPSFAGNSLQVVGLPGGAVDNSLPAGGTANTGFLQVDGLGPLAPSESLSVVFRVSLAPVLANGSTVSNQSQLVIGSPIADSDDPNVNGQADPFVPGDEDPTTLTIQSAPAFRVQKISDDITGDPAVLLSGDGLRYTITVANVGTADAFDVVLRDAIPANTTYVAGSTTLNGAPVADVGGTSPLVSGLSIFAPANTTPGTMLADATAPAIDTATITFEVVTDTGLPDGTVISNQGFVSAPAGGVIDQPSDDPATPVVDDPTRDVVGNSPLLFASKDVVLQVDNNLNGQVDALDELRYTIVVTNTGAVPATMASLRDAVPANTTYLADSAFLNTIAVGPPASPTFPLAAGLPISSSDLTPPLPGAGAGVIDPGQSATFVFDLQVNAGTAPGTLITNQAVVTTNELAPLLTDGDGNPSTGPEPTVVVVGGGQQLTIAKSVTVVGGGPVLPGSILEYTVVVTNPASSDATDVVITDDLDFNDPGYITYVPGSATLDGSAVPIGFAPNTITADYSTTFGPLVVGASTTLRFRATVLGSLSNGTRITNTAVVSWNAPTQQAQASVSIDVGGTPGIGLLSGAAWHDANFDGVQDAAEIALTGWFVDLLRNGSVIQTATIDATGAYSFVGVAPNDVTGDAISLRFRAPDAAANTASLGTTISPFTNGQQEISDVVVTSGSNLLDLSLPITPNGVVYGALSRTVVAGAVVRMTDLGGTLLSSACFADANQQGQTTRSDGYYKFQLVFGDASCPSPGSYLIDVTLPAGGSYVSGPSAFVPPTTDASTAPINVPTCPGGTRDAISATSSFCEAQGSELAPAPSIPAGSGTAHYLHLTFDATGSPGTSEIFNNHIPVDPVLSAAVSVTKSTPRTDVVRGDLVPYEIGFANEFGATLGAFDIVDRVPAGFRYVDGSALLDGRPMEPVVTGRVLSWPDVGLPTPERRKLVLLLAVGAGVRDGEYVNRALATLNATGAPISGVATATVRVSPDPTFDCTDVIGKVFDDADRDGIQDDGERGLSGVRLVTARGLIATTDPYGRFHIACAIVPDEDRGSNFVLKLDDRSLPSGYRMSTRKTQVKRATRGKALRFSFGASVNRVVELDLSDAAFAPDSTELREHWRPRIDLLMEELEASRAVLRISYVADLESKGLVERRIDAVKDLVGELWEDQSDEELPIETEIFWRKGGPGEGSGGLFDGRSIWKTLGDALGNGPSRADTRAGGATEKQLPGSARPTLWAVDPERVETQVSDRLEEREVPSQQVEIVKRAGVVPPIRFDSGGVNIPEPTIEALRRVLRDMEALPNVRLHLVGHADDQPLSGALALRYGDNEGLSRERAGEAAEFLQRALNLPPGSISFEWRGASEPIASNATAAGRARNRRVEVEVWHDAPRNETTIQDFVVSEEIKRVKVCRMETVCKMRYQAGRERRTRVKNLVEPLRYDPASLQVTPEFLTRVRAALQDLSGERRVTIRFIGHTDDTPLEGRDERIYGDHLALSKARARRVALAVREALSLPSAAVDSDGRGASRPLASNETASGRATNRRIEVEFWHDDPLQELPEDPQICPDAADLERITQIYDPPWGRLPTLGVEDGEIVVPEDFDDKVRRALDDVVDRDDVRLRFVGYTGNQRLDRRTARVYGDDIGLSTARARRAKQLVAERLGMDVATLEHEGHGFVHSADVINGGFSQDERSYVSVQVVYDEPAVLDLGDGIDVTKVTRELRPEDPLDLNTMRISVDGEPLDDMGRSYADVQRCTDVALDRADIQFRFDDATPTARLSVTAEPASLAVLAGPAPTPVADAPDALATEDADAEARALEAAPGGATAGGPVRFRAYTNYAQFIERAEVRIFEPGESVNAEPLAVVAVGEDGVAAWWPSLEATTPPVRELSFVLRAYDAKGRFDETEPQRLWLHEATDGVGVPGALGAADSAGENGGGAVGASTAPLFEGYGETGGLKRNIPFGRAGTVRVQGRGVPAGHQVWLAGARVPVDESGAFVAEAVLPAGMHTVEVAVLDPDGNGELFLRDLEIEESDWFAVGLADLTLSHGIGDDARDELAPEDGENDGDELASGRLAFFVNGHFGPGFELTASADTEEGPVEHLFDNFLDKRPESFFRRIEEEYHYPTFGDDGTVEEAAPTSGKLFVELSKDDSRALWGNFRVGYLENELAHVDRALYGLNLTYQSLGTTKQGDRRLAVDGYAATPGTVSSREELRGTGGSLYFLRRQDLLVGSERVRIEVRDKDSGLVTSVQYLESDVDYDIDYLQGRILLAKPLGSTADDSQLVRTAGIDGDEVYLVVQYEYTPGFDELDAMAFGGRAQAWLTDWVGLGATASRNEADADESTLYGGDLTLRKSSLSFVKAQVGHSEGVVSESFVSGDGGFDFLGTGTAIPQQADANAYRVDAALGFGDVFAALDGRVTVYGQRLEAGYSAPGLAAPNEVDQYGGTLDLPLPFGLHASAKADHRVEDRGLSTTAAEADFAYTIFEGLKLSAGVRTEDRDDDATLVPVTQETGARTDTTVQLDVDIASRWDAYAFGQGTVDKDATRDSNNRYGVGGHYRVTDTLALEGEVSHGDFGPALSLGANHQVSRNTERYFTYALDNERGEDGVHERRGNLVTGQRSRISDSTSIYMEDRYQHAESSTGLARSMGLTMQPAESWTIGGKWELGTLVDRRTAAETERKSGGVRLGYATDALRVSSGFEYRNDDREEGDGSSTTRETWLLTNSFRVKLDPDWRMVGRFDQSISESSEGEAEGAEFTEAVVGFGYRPIAHDRLNLFAKYTYFYNMPAASQLSGKGTNATFIQRSHVAAIDATYDLTSWLTLGGKYAFRRGEVALEREDPEFFSNDAHLAILRGDIRFLENWETSLEGRVLILPDLDEQKRGALITLYRYFGDNVKLGVGYNFTDFSEDLTDLSYRHHGVFMNLIGSF